MKRDDDGSIGGIMTHGEAEIVGILKDAAAAHHHAPKGEGGTSELHTTVANLINGILAGGNSVRRRQLKPRVC